jgi:RNA-directed DNA polymerase
MAEVSRLFDHSMNDNLRGGDVIAAGEFSEASRQVVWQHQPEQDNGLVDHVGAVSQPMGTESAPTLLRQGLTREQVRAARKPEGATADTTPTCRDAVRATIVAEAGESPEMSEGSQETSRPTTLGNDTPAEERGIWIPDLQRRLAEKTVQHPDHRFTGLYPLIWNTAVLEEAAVRLLGNKGSRTPGLDGITRDALRRNQDYHLRLLQTQLREKTFQPTPVKRVYIPKANGKQRPLGIPTLYDRWVQMAVKIVIEPIFESNFAEFSHGFRPKRSCHTAMAHIHRLTAQRRRKVYWVIEGDIEGCFDHVHHKRLMTLLRERIQDRELLDLIWRFLRAGVMENALFTKTEKGTPQGGILSPLLANIYLNRFDQWFAKRAGIGEHPSKRERNRKAGHANFMMVRYADDFVVFSNGTKAETEAFKDELQQWFADDLRLTLSPEKTKITHYTDGYDFLGFTFKKTTSRTKGEETVVIYPSTESVQRIIRRISDMTSRKTLLDSPGDKIDALNALLRGWGEYFRRSSAKATLRYVGSHAYMEMWRWLQARSGMQHGWKAIKARYGHDNTWTADGSTLIKLGYMPIEYPFYRAIPNPYLTGQPVMEPRHYDPLLAEWDGNRAYGPEWRTIRDAIRERDGGCVVCGSAEVEIHHIRAKGTSRGTDHPTNLVALCRKHHRESENPVNALYHLIRENALVSGEPDARKRARPVRGAAS